MDEKTEELRDIFIDIAGAGTVTERQEEGHGSLSGADEAEIVDRLRAVVATMRDRFDFEADCDDETLARIVRGFYEGEDDEALAADLDLAVGTVFEARMDLHLVGEDDTDAPLSMATLRDLLAAGADEETLAAELDAERATIDRYRRVATAQNRIRRTSHRFQTAFEDVLTDADLSVRLTAGVQNDGLEEATEDIESDVSF